ncbi:MAG: S49 family peptidase [Alphaproteobacteria bacterium]|nr:S49 family peptidase [Alphaproteobacteria bacterium]OJV16093.1 MAG: hypothetical protein BGO27_03800 [Alphaproteobacteria bacterium 33-17]
MKALINKFKPKPTVAVISFKGVIGVKKNGITIDQYNSILEKAFTSKPKAVVIQINSPGGAPVQSDLIYRKIRKLSKKYSIPTYSYLEDVAASGGYYIAASCDEIIASDNSIVGSIGVISAGFGFTKALDKLGIERRVYTVGKNKSILDPFLPENENDKAIIREVQDDIFENFKGAIMASRGTKIKDPEEVFTGRIWSGKKALDHGLIDHLADLDSFLEEKFGTNFKIQKYEPKKKGLLSRFGLGDVISDIYEELRWLR